MAWEEDMLLDQSLGGSQTCHKQGRLLSRGGLAGKATVLFVAGNTAAAAAVDSARQSGGGDYCTDYYIDCRVDQ